MDFKILSEYLFDDNAVMQQASPQLPKRATSKAKGAAKGGATKKRGIIVSSVIISPISRVEKRIEKKRSVFYFHLVLI